MKKQLNGRARTVVIALAGLAAVVGCSSSEVGSDTTGKVGDPAAAPAADVSDLSTGSALPTIGADALLLQAAKKGLASFLEAIPAGEEAEYGFAERADFGRIELGAPYEYFRLADSGETSPSNEWGVPLLVDGQMRALLHLTHDGTVYQVRGLGSAKLSSELQNMETVRLANGAAPIKARAIVRSFTHVATFVNYDADLHTVDGLRDAKLIALESARMAFARKIDALPAALRGQGISSPLSPSTVKALVAQ